MRKLLILAGILALGAVRLAGTGGPQAKPFLGAWNLTGTGPDSANVYWLEVTEDAGQLKGMFLNRVGNPAPLGVVKVENGELIFQAGSATRPNGPEYHATLSADGKLIGRHSMTQGGGRNRAADPNAPPPTPRPERVVNWIGVRPPAWPASDANAKHTYGTPVELFNHKSLEMWDVQVANRPMGWSIDEAVLTNARIGDAPPIQPAGGVNTSAPQTPANNLVSKQKFMDFKLEAEYKVAKESNSGIFLRGRYELQILDDAEATGGRPDFGHMAIYGRTPPLVKASKPAGEWQTMEAILVGNRVTVTLNGQRVQDNAIIAGITGGALDNNEATPGPILIQGDHKEVWIRKLVVTPIVK